MWWNHNCGCVYLSVTSWRCMLWNRNCGCVYLSVTSWGCLLWNRNCGCVYLCAIWCGCPSHLWNFEWHREGACGGFVIVGVCISVWHCEAYWYMSIEPALSWLITGSWEKPAFQQPAFPLAGWCLASWSAFSQTAATLHRPHQLFDDHSPVSKLSLPTHNQLAIPSIPHSSLRACLAPVEETWDWEMGVRVMRSVLSAPQ